MRRNLPVYACELAGTALMLFWGVTAVSDAQLRRVTRETFGRAIAETRH